MKIPVIKPTKFTFEIREILDELSGFINSDEVKEALPRLHKDNEFNRRMGAVNSSFSDVEAITERMVGDIMTLIDEERKKSNLSSKHISLLKVDLRSLYVHIKILLDDYVKLLQFITPFRGIPNYSITAFFNKLNKYKGAEPAIIDFNSKCLEYLRGIDEHIREYRDISVVHNHNKHKQRTEWFVNGMNGEIRFSGGAKSSLTPQEVLFIAKQFIDRSAQFVMESIAN